MVDIRRKDIKGQEDRRKNPRLEFHCEARIKGIKNVVKITDISLEGFFFELKTSSRLKMGQAVDVNLSFPTKNKPVRVTAKFINQTKKGIGCEFVNLSPQNKEDIQNCFETFKDMIPIK